MFGWIKKIMFGTPAKQTSANKQTSAKSPEEIAQIRAHNLALIKKVHQRMIAEGKLPKPV